MPDTIVALATPVGRSGIGVIRLSGSDSLTITKKLLFDDDFVPKPRTAFLRQLQNDGETIDEALITYFQAPHTFTGEDVIEISCHGSPVLIRQIIDTCLSLDARLANAGEFTLRALGNGRIDLAEAEAIRDLIDAQTAASARQAVRQMRGELSQRLQPFKDELLKIIVVLESALEFVEDDLPLLQLESIKQSLAAVADKAGELADTFKAGHLIRDGLRVAIVGRPNVGKSSLFNALLGSDRAIVTDIAGTTRDQIHERIVFENLPISLIDTAGLRETNDTVESIGVARSRGIMADADVVIVMLDATEALTVDACEVLDSVSSQPYLIALNKIDKASANEISDLQRLLSERHRPILKISAKTGAGLDDLLRAVIGPFSAGGKETTGGFLITDARHYDLLKRTGSEIISSADQLNEGQSEEIVLIGLHNALRYLGEITGETTTEDMLTRIFSTFCIGK